MDLMKIPSEKKLIQRTNALMTLSILELADYYDKFKGKDKKSLCIS